MPRQLWFSLLCLALVGPGPSSAHAQCAGGAWIDAAQMRITRQAMGVGRVGNLLYIYGGLLSGDPLTPILAADVLNLQTGGSAIIAFLPSARYYPASAALRDEPYVIGGFFGTSEVSNLVWAYDPLHDEWNRKANLPTRRAGCVAVSSDDQIFVFGGVAANLIPQASVYAYDPTADAWTAKTNMPTRRTRMAIAESDGQIYVLGGYNADGDPLAVVEKYDVALDEWTTLEPMSVARAEAAAGIVNGKLYVVGGESDGVVGSTEAYDPITGQWSCHKDMKAARHSSIAVSGTDRLYVLGGSPVPGIDPVNTVDAFMPPEFVATRPASMGSLKARYSTRGSQQ